MAPHRPQIEEADDDFVIELDEELTEITPLTLQPEPEDDLSALDEFGGDDRPPPEPTTLMSTAELEHSLHQGPELFADIQRAKEAGVSLASSIIEPLPESPQALLTISDGREPVPITKSVFILGRGAEVSDVVLNSGKVSRQHAAIIFARGEFFIEDLNSTNGTLVSGKRVKRVRLAPGLSVRIGNFTLRLSFGD